MSSSLTVYYWCILGSKTQFGFWIPPSISVREMLNPDLDPIPSSVFEGSLTVTLLWWHFRELDPTLRIQEKSSKISSKDGIRSTWLAGMSSGFRASWLVTWESHISSTFSNKLFTSDYRNCKFTFIRIQAANFLEPYGIFREIFQKFSPAHNPQNHFWDFLDILI